MSLTTFAHEYDTLAPGEQQQFTEAIRRLLSNGLLWRGDDADYRPYAFVLRRQNLVATYLQVAGWELHHNERTSVFYVVHREGAHRRRLNRDTTIWLLLLRLIYTEQHESMSVSLNRYPTVSIGDLYSRYTEFFPGKPVRKKTSLDNGLRTLQSLKLIRPAGGGSLRASNIDQLIELLPTLEVVVPAHAVDEVASRLQEYDRSRSQSEDDDDNEDNEEQA
ncbi:MAG: DUF4194 domain-containing protein [Ardenticatenaceae bacterium]